MSNSFNIQMNIPDKFIDEDGEVIPEFYEPLFNMLGKKYGGAVINSIKVDFDED